MTWQSDVTDFHRAMGFSIGATPEIRNAELNAKLIAEEASETLAALGFSTSFIWWPGDDIAVEPTRDVMHAGKICLTDAIDGIIDLCYVAIGTAVTAGVDLQPIWEEVHRSNIAKAGGPKREDGKQLKPPGWQPPDVAGLIAEQLVFAPAWS